jgi:hypothetical protein
MKCKHLWIIVFSLIICQSAVAQKSIVTQRSTGSQTYLAQVKPMGSKDWGYINLNGDLVIEAKYRKSFPFSKDGFAPVYDARVKEYCFIDASGQKLNTEIRDYDLLSMLGFGVKGFSDGLVPVRKNKKWGFLDTGGNVSIELKYDKVTEFNGGYAAAEIRGEFLVLDQNGEEFPVEIERLDNIKHFSEGLAPFFRVDDRVGFIDAYGNVAIPAQYIGVGYFSGGLAWAKTSDKLIGFINHEGEWVIDPQFSAAKDFSPNDGLARVKLNDRWGYVNEYGEMMYVEDTDIIGTFYEGFCKARKDGLVGFIDTYGEWIIPPQYEAVRDFKNGYAAAKLRDKWGLINTKGEWVINPEYAAVRDMEIVY